ncbi:hypothetical protein KSP40_PGU005234 [Platanthera guangdongensis]|uniref:Small ribosomal subunit protein uS2c n=1 Tax=Platanthera guangdongensis TaxID=2320717 RepID=A0ABR2LNJ1_9ASPA
MERRYWNINLEEMMEAGVHFGHGTKKWNPKMAPYISAKRKGIHITNLTITARFLSEACDLVFDAASGGKKLLIVGTKKKVADLVASAAIRARCHYVNKKWLGGMLTNWSTTETRLQKFRDLRAEKKMGKLNRLPPKMPSPAVLPVVVDSFPFKFVSFVHLVLNLTFYDFCDVCQSCLCSLILASVASLPFNPCLISPDVNFVTIHPLVPHRKEIAKHHHASPDSYNSFESSRAHPARDLPATYGESTPAVFLT